MTIKAVVYRDAHTNVQICHKFRGSFASTPSDYSMASPELATSLLSAVVDESSKNEHLLSRRYAYYTAPFICGEQYSLAAAVSKKWLSRSACHSWVLSNHPPCSSSAMSINQWIL